MTKTGKIILLILAVLSGQLLPAQNGDAEQTKIVEQIMDARKLSNNLLPKYTWTSRVEILKSKEILNIMIEKNHYDSQGQLVQKVLNDQGAKMPTAFLVREIAETEKQNMEKFLFGLRDFLKKYSLQQSDQVSRYISAASLQVAGSQDAFIFTGRNVEVEGDEMTWWVEDKNYSTMKIEVNTVFEGDAIHFNATFNRRNDGLNYMAYAEALIPAKNMTLQIQNYDYIIED